MTALQVVPLVRCTAYCLQKRQHPTDLQLALPQSPTVLSSCKDQALDAQVQEHSFATNGHGVFTLSPNPLHVHVNQPGLATRVIGPGQLVHRLYFQLQISGDTTSSSRISIPALFQHASGAYY